MTQSRRNESQRQTPTEHTVRNDGEQSTAEDESLFDAWVRAEEILDIGHAHLRSECWMAARHRTLHWPRPARARTPRHLARPSSAAEARFAFGPCEFIE